MLAQLLFEKLKLERVEIYQDVYPNKTIHRYLYCCKEASQLVPFEENFSFNETIDVSLHVFPTKDALEIALDGFRHASYLRGVPTII